MQLVRFVLVLALMLAPTFGHGDSRQVPQDSTAVQLSFAPVVKRSAPAVVNIYAARVVETRVSPFAGDPFFSQFFSGPVVPRMENSLGSGVIVDAGGLVVSNYHVVGEASEIRVVLADRREFDARIVLADQEADLAILRLEGARDLPVLELADSDAAEVGDLVLAIGNPFGVGQTVTSGIVSGLARSGTGLGGSGGYLIQTDAPINPGNSGGALVDMAGRLLGINTSILTRSGGSNGIGFAIPSDLVAAYVAAARAGKDRFPRPWLGAETQVVDSALAEALGQNIPRGVVITDMHPQSPLAAAGLQPGDVILAVNGREVAAPETLRYRLATAGGTGKVTLSVIRGGAPEEIELTLGEAPDDPPAEPTFVPGFGPFSGLLVSRINPALIDLYDLPLHARGFLVQPGQGAPARAGLRAGDIILSVNGVEPDSPQQLAQILASDAPLWDLELVRDGRRLRMRLRG